MISGSLITGSRCHNENTSIKRIETGQSDKTVKISIEAALIIR